ncbi:MAG: ParA family protein [Bdellovibrionota bacterium]|nr:ParA family protein [Pseudomonadota bacterium]MDY6090596.1 ParA family protein [Bdellovibrionota bacterium]
MKNIISVSNQKGGVGKTTSAVSLASEMAKMGRSVLLIDLDPQASASSGLGVKLQSEGEDLYDVFFGNISISKIIKQCLVNNLDVVPGSKDLVSLELEIGKTQGRELILQTELSLLKKQYDYIYIDCPPSSGLLTLNALGASDYILIPLQAEYYALEGISGLMNTVNFVKQTFNPKLELLGVFLTMYDYRTKLSGLVEEEARKFFNDLVFKTIIPRNIRLSECPSYSQPICVYDPKSIGAKAYHELATEVDFRAIRRFKDHQEALDKLQEEKLNKVSNN